MSPRVAIGGGMDGDLWSFCCAHRPLMAGARKNCRAGQTRLCPADSEPARAT